MSIKNLKIIDATPLNEIEIETEWNYADLKSHLADELELNLRCEMHRYFTDHYPECANEEHLCTPAKKSVFTLIEFDSACEAAKGQLEFGDTILTATIE